MPRAANSLNLNDLRWNRNQQTVLIEAGSLNSLVWDKQPVVVDYARRTYMVEFPYHKARPQPQDNSLELIPKSQQISLFGWRFIESINLSIAKRRR